MAANPKDAGWPVPLKAQDDSAGDAIRQYAQVTEQTGNGEAAAYERVVARVSDRNPRRYWIAAGASLTALLVASAVLLPVRTRAVDVLCTRPTSVSTAPVAGQPDRWAHPSPRSLVRLGPAPTRLPAGWMDLGGEATALLSADAVASGRMQEQATEVALDSGRIELRVPPRAPGRTFSLTADSYRFTVVGTAFAVSLGPSSVDLSVGEGLVAVSRDGGHQATVAAGETWSAVRPAPEPVAGVPKSRARMRASRSAKAMGAADASDCERLVRGGRMQEAIACFEGQAQEVGLAGERAQHELARLLRDRVDDPERALAAFEAQLSRFPHGLLRVETDLAIIDLLFRLGRHTEALVASELFLADHPEVEERGEIRLLRGDIYREVFGDLDRAEREYIGGAETRGRVADDSRFLRALCLEGLGREAEARRAYQSYLQQAGAAHLQEARRRINRLRP